MLSVSISCWSAMVPGLETPEKWRHWFAQPSALPVDTPLPSKLPPMMRRRLSPLGRLAVAAALPLLENEDELPLIFASRYGDATRVLSLLKELARGKPLSPTEFSLSVHNAISGVVSIARKDVSAVTALACSNSMVLSMLFEAIGQLQQYPKLLCILCDAPLPEIYRSEQLPGPVFPYALAMLLNRTPKQVFLLKQIRASRQPDTNQYQDFLALVRLLLELKTEAVFSTSGASWRFTKHKQGHAHGALL